MTHVLENNLLRVTIDSLGAEVTSVVDKTSGEELWWCGDAAFWKGHSPILFPACGGLWNGEYKLDGKTITMTIENDNAMSADPTQFGIDGFDSMEFALY